MKIIRKSQVSGIIRAFDMDVTPVQLAHWDMGMDISDAAPQLSFEQQHFIETGIAPSELLNLCSLTDILNS